MNCHWCSWMCWRDNSSRTQFWDCECGSLKIPNVAIISIIKTYQLNPCYICVYESWPLPQFSINDFLYREKASIKFSEQPKLSLNYLSSCLSSLRACISGRCRHTWLIMFWFLFTQGFYSLSVVILWWKLVTFFILQWYCLIFNYDLNSGVLVFKWETISFCPLMNWKEYFSRRLRQKTF